MALMDFIATEDALRASHEHLESTARGLLLAAGFKPGAVVALTVYDVRCWELYWDGFRGLELQGGMVAARCRPIRKDGLPYARRGMSHIPVRTLLTDGTLVSEAQP
jgi:hypothetical protein